MKDLGTIITPSLLRQLAHARLPWPQTEHIPGTALMTELLTAPTLQHTAHLAWPALLSISRTYGPDTIPDLTPLLPRPDAPAFPNQALGMHVLLDQCPRLLFRGPDARWTSYFDRVVRALYAFLYGLPPHLRPWARGRWRAASLEYWFCAAFEFNASTAHQESVPHQGVSARRVEEIRGVVEGYAGVRDPARDGEGAAGDVYAFPRLVRGVDLERPWEFHEAAFFWLEVVDAHRPIVEMFGRYPYRNAIEGRESTAEEVLWIEKTDHFAEAPPGVARKVREDVDAGRWTPLGQDCSTSVVSIPSGTAVRITLQAPDH